MLAPTRGASLGRDDSKKEYFIADEQCSPLREALRLVEMTVRRSILLRTSNARPTRGASLGRDDGKKEYFIADEQCSPLRIGGSRFIKASALYIITCQRAFFPPYEAASTCFVISTEACRVEKSMRQILLSLVILRLAEESSLSTFKLNWSLPFLYILSKRHTKYTKKY